MKNTIKRKPMTITTPVQFSAPAGDQDTRHFSIEAYTGAVIDTWFGKLVFDVSGMSAKKNIPILREHERDRVVGYGTGSQDGKTFSVMGRFSKSTPDAQECLALAEEGYPWQASVGIRPVKVKTIGEKEEASVNGQILTGPAEIWLKSQVGEVSFVTLGADDHTSISVFSQPDSGDEIEVEHLPSTQEEKIPMTKEELFSQSPELAAELKAEGYAEGIQTERSRVTQILASDPDHKHLAVLCSAIEAGTAADGVFKALFEAERQMRQTGLKNLADQATPPVGQSREEATQPAPLKFMDAAKKLASEKGMSLAAAVRETQKTSPELHAAYLKEIAG